jgi:hypothetical protein
MCPIQHQYLLASLKILTEHPKATLESNNYEECNYLRPLRVRSTLVLGKSAYVDFITVFTSTHPT